MPGIAEKKFKKIEQWYSTDLLSARKIAEKLSVSQDAVYYILRKLGIRRRTAREQNRLRFERQPPSFYVSQKLFQRERELFIAGLMLYWCEGAQWSGEKSVDLANSNPLMVALFLKFLRRICHVNEKRLRCYLYCYANQKVGRLIRFWSGVTRIPKTQFTKPYVRYDFNPEKSHKMPYGLIHIRYSDKKLLYFIINAISSLTQDLNHGRIPK